MKYLILYLSILTFLLSQAQNKEILLNKNWQFSQKGKNTWHKATVPGCVHTDLKTNKLIPDPFFSDNETKLHWIENEDWEYKTNFTLKKSDPEYEHIELQFAGLDTYAKVYLNDSLILTSDNMFRSWDIDVKNYLKSGNNTLYIIFESAAKKGKELASKLSYTLPGEEKVFTRKAQYQYGWDWGPRFVTCGIYKPVMLRFIKQSEIKNISYIINSISDSLAEVTFECDIQSYTGGVHDLFITNITGKTTTEVTPDFQKNSILQKGVMHYTIPITIINPKRWWCNGLGEPFLYNFEFTLAKKSGPIDKKTISLGIRTIELVREKDQIGESFYFKLNGKPVFMKGANYIPSDNFISRITDSAYVKDVLLAKNAHMNMLRVWGGGFYPENAFYNACDKNGILVWQDFMFACAMYPGDSAFIKNVKHEITEQIIRLKNHPCLALWCGNNENDEGWKNWGWQKQYNYSKSDSAKILNDYINLFQNIVPELIKTYSPKINYISSTPQIGWGHKESLTHGDSHYWGVWWGNEPFEVYETKVGRFMSEYGFQSMPELSTFKTFCPDNSLDLKSAAVKNHQKHPTGYNTIQTYMEREFKVPQTFENFIYVSQLVQAKGIQMAIDAHRSNKPRCMGTLIWQLNDCWPVTSWSIYDYYKKPKALYYNLKKLFDDATIVISKTDNLDYSIVLINDKPQHIEGKLETVVKDFYGKVLLEKITELNLPAFSHSTMIRFLEKDLRAVNKNRSYIQCTFTDKNNFETHKQYYFAPPKDLDLPAPKVEWSYDDKTQILKIKSNVLTKDVYLKNNFSFLEDNYFDLLPNKEKCIKAVFSSKNKESLTFLSLYDINSAK